mgnify:CR=1 FL=1
MIHDYLPVTRQDMETRGWDQCDFVYVTGDAYVDHPSFGTAIISRLLEARRLPCGDHFPAGLENKGKYTDIRTPQAGLFSFCGKYGLHGEPLFRIEKAPGKRMPILREASWENGRIMRLWFTAT